MPNRYECSSLQDVVTRVEMGLTRDGLFGASDLFQHDAYRPALPCFTCGSALSDPQHGQCARGPRTAPVTSTVGCLCDGASTHGNMLAKRAHAGETSAGH